MPVTKVATNSALRDSALLRFAGGTTAGAFTIHVPTTSFTQLNTTGMPAGQIWTHRGRFIINETDVAIKPADDRQFDTNLTPRQSLDEMIKLGARELFT